MRPADIRTLRKTAEGLSGKVGCASGTCQKSGHSKRTEFKATVRYVYNHTIFRPPRRTRGGTARDSLEQEGNMLKQRAMAKERDVKTMGEPGAKTRLDRDRHVFGCLYCKCLLNMMALSVDDDYEMRALEEVKPPIAEPPEPPNLRCTYGPRVHHEQIPRALALKMIGLARGDRPRRDIHDALVSIIAFEVRRDDAPKGWTFSKKDALRRHVLYPPDSVHNVSVRLGSKRVSVPVRINPSFKSRRQDVYDLPTLANMQETSERSVPAIRARRLRKYEELKGLDRMNLNLEEGLKKGRNQVARSANPRNFVLGHGLRERVNR